MTVVGIALGVATFAAIAQTAFHYSVKTMPASVVKTVPVAGATDVDSAQVKEITVTFSKDMADKSWSVPTTTPEENFPKISGNIHYQPDKRTCVVPVQLEPGRTYVVWFNNQKFMNFRDTSGKSSIPYLLVFETKK